LSVWLFVSDSAYVYYVHESYYEDNFTNTNHYLVAHLIFCLCSALQIF